METMRLFLAVTLDDHIKDELNNINNELRKELEGRISWVQRDNFHLTLKFLGEVDTNRISDIDSMLSEVAEGFSPFGFEIEGLGCFPGPDKARVLWSGLRGFSEQLPEMHTLIDATCSRLGFRKERRGFSPHITLARINGGLDQNQLKTALKKNENRFVGECWVESFVLMQSRLGRGGARYEVLARYPFAKG